MRERKKWLICLGSTLCFLLAFLIFSNTVRKNEKETEHKLPKSSLPESVSSVEDSQEERENSEKSEPQKFSLVLEMADHAKKQSEVVISLKVKNNPGVLGMKLQLVFDETAMQLLDAVPGEAFAGDLSMTPPGHFYSGCSFLWDGVALSENDGKDGEILSLKFQIPESAKAGKYPVSVLYEPGDIIDAELSELFPETETAFLQIE